MKVAVVIPALAARETIGDVVARVARACPGAPIVVVDDGSSDGTDRVAEGAGATVLRHGANLGKGAALRTGIAEALRAGARSIVTVDADGQHVPEAIPTLLASLHDGADLAIGGRARQAGVMPWQRRLTNYLSSRALGAATGQTIVDAQSGFRAFARSVAVAVQPTGSRYEFEMEFLYLAAMLGFGIAWVPVPTVYAGAASHFRPVRDTARLVALHTRLGARRTLGRP